MMAWPGRPPRTAAGSTVSIVALCKCEPRIPAQIRALARVRHRTKGKLAVLEGHLDPGDPRRPVGSQGGDRLVPVPVEELPHASCELRFRALDVQQNRVRVGVTLFGQPVGPLAQRPGPRRGQLPGRERGGDQRMRGQPPGPFNGRTSGAAGDVGDGPQPGRRPRRAPLSPIRIRLEKQHHPRTRRHDPLGDPWSVLGKSGEITLGFPVPPHS